MSAKKSETHVKTREIEWRDRILENILRPIGPAGDTGAAMAHIVADTLAMGQPFLVGDPLCAKIFGSLNGTHNQILHWNIWDIKHNI